MAKPQNNIPSLLTDSFNDSGIKYTISKGAIYYHSIDDYKAGQHIIKMLEKKLPRQGYNKFGNKKVKLVISTVKDVYGPNGIGLIPCYSDELVTFDSEDEADYYYCLKDEFDAGRITKIVLHPRLELFPKFVDGGGMNQIAMVYTPDFYVDYADGRREYVDVKGMSTEAGDLRRKLYNYLAFGKCAPIREFAGIPLRWVSTSFKYGNADGWIDYDELQQIRANNRKAKKKTG